MHKRRISTGGWGRSAASSWTSKQKPSSCRPKSRHGIKTFGRIQGGNGDERTGKGKVGPSRLPARDGRRRRSCSDRSRAACHGGRGRRVRCRQEKGSLSGEFC